MQFRFKLDDRATVYRSEKRYGFLRSSFLRNHEVGSAKGVRTENSTLGAHVLHGKYWRGSGDACRIAVVCPVRLATGDSTLGLLGLGSTPIELMMRIIATSYSS